MEAITIENVRCFKGRIRARLAPLTLLVGENSTGKTTLLSMIRIAWDLRSRTVALDFNEPPFRLGSYDRIAHYHGGRAKRAQSFSIGFEVKARRPRGQHDEPQNIPPLVSAQFEFASNEGRPEVVSWTASVGD